MPFHLWIFMTEDSSIKGKEQREKIRLKLLEDVKSLLENPLVRQEFKDAILLHKPELKIFCGDRK